MYDQYALIPIPDGVAKHLGIEEDLIRVHQHGYVESDTNAAVGDDEWEWYSEENGVYRELNEREMQTVFPVDSKIIATHFSGVEGCFVYSCARDKKPFPYKDELWRVFYTRGVWQYRENSTSRYSQISEKDNWQIFVILIPFDAEVLWEYINDEVYRNNSLKWHECDCMSDWGSY